MGEAVLCFVRGNRDAALWTLAVECEYIYPIFVPRVQKIEVRKLALTDFYWLNL